MDEQEEVKFNVNMKSFEGTKKYQTKSQINVYTDGSKIDEKLV
jgi:hypothetical protein